MKKTFLPFLTAGALLATASIGHATLIAGFNFNNATSASGFGTFNTSGTDEVFNSGTEVITPATHGDFKASASVNLAGLVGTMGGTISNNWGASSVSTVVNAVGVDIAGFSLGVAGTSNNNASVVFSAPTTGRTDIILTYATRAIRENVTHVWAYSTDGVNYTNYSPQTSFNSATWFTNTVDMTAVSAIENQAMVYFRLTYSGMGLANTVSLVDNVQINGVIPEPGAALLGGLGLLALLRRRR